MALAVLLLVQGDLDQRAVAHHHLEVGPAPVARHVRQNLAPLRLLVDDASGRRQVCLHLALEMKRHVWIGLEIGQPAPPISRGRAADVDPAADVVEHDLDPARLPTLSAGRSDIDRVTPLQRGVDRVVRSCHSKGSYQSVPARIPSRRSARDRRCRPAASKFSLASQASKAARQAGHSESMIENQAVSRLRPLSTRWCRKRPSNVKPKRSAARLEPAFSSLHFHSRRRLPRSSNACLAMRKIASVAWRLFWSRGESQMCPISMTPCSGTMLMKVAIPVAARAERSMMA